ncbi:enoyl-CoA hydratase/isomerase family protein [Kordiimonas sp. SCSIO 12603]|uniref:enoyl-CoA hydratase/isomerase family protein n=1 Tax=Kordiimonas sp. SCSIO 12603 TaxID=2829596 RepID=UPI002101DE72|nr:enoyl-CoA hydratase/isomerase family protein [Kordiimonas sp. SCSIO 12603]UTW57235.1 enoyl-CoA hydratase/isomerase family protein [Kordiimonas sp. SCSIO 12603]
MVDTLLTSIEDNGVATVTLNRADVHNAFNDDLIWELNNAFKTLGENPDVRAIILTGGGKSFSAGADLNWMKAAASYTEEQNQRDAMNLSGMLATLNNCPKPTIAIVNGATFGGGVGLVSCCDMAIAVESAKFSLSEVRLGLTPATISPYVVAAIGERHARRYFLTAERFDAAKAQEIGLVHELAPSLQEAFSLANVLVKNILGGAPTAQAEAKDLITFVKGKEITEELRTNTAERIAARRASEEGKEGLSAFLEKRKPSWIIDKGEDA